MWAWEFLIFLNCTYVNEVQKENEEVELNFYFDWTLMSTNCGDLWNWNWILYDNIVASDIKHLIVGAAIWYCIIIDLFFFVFTPES